MVTDDGQGLTQSRPARHRVHAAVSRYERSGSWRISYPRGGSAAIVIALFLPPLIPQSRNVISTHHP